MRASKFYQRGGMSLRCAILILNVFRLPQTVADTIHTARLWSCVVSSGVYKARNSMRIRQTRPYSRCQKVSTTRFVQKRKKYKPPRSDFFRDAVYNQAECACSQLACTKHAINRTVTLVRACVCNGVRGPAVNTVASSLVYDRRRASVRVM